MPWSNPMQKVKEVVIRRVEHICVPDEPDVEGWIIYGGGRCTQYAEGKNPSPKSRRNGSEFIVERRMTVDNVPFQSEFEEPNPTRLRVQSPSKWRKRVGNIRIFLDFELKFSEGPQ